MLVITDFIKEIEEEFQFEDENCVLSPSTEFRKLEAWSSMLALVVIVRITDAYGVVLDEAELKACRTVADLYRAVVNKTEGGGDTEH